MDGGPRPPAHMDVSEAGMFSLLLSFAPKESRTQNKLQRKKKTGSHSDRRFFKLNLLFCPYLTINSQCDRAG